MHLAQFYDSLDEVLIKVAPIKTGWERERVCVESEREFDDP